MWVKLTKKLNPTLSLAQHNTFGFFGCLSRRCLHLSEPNVLLSERCLQAQSGENIQRQYSSDLTNAPFDFVNVKCPFKWNLMVCQCLSHLQCVDATTAHSGLVCIHCWPCSINSSGVKLLSFLFLEGWGVAATQEMILWDKYLLWSCYNIWGVGGWGLFLPCSTKLASAAFPSSHLLKANITIYAWVLGNDKWLCAP